MKPQEYDDFNFFPDHPIGEFTTLDSAVKDQPEEKKSQDDLED